MSISVIIPVYNRGPRVQPTLDSILAQTLAPLEIIVIDDGSSDGSADWIEAHYGAKVHVIRQSNGGVARARNCGLAMARGEYIAFCDHDDVWLPRKLELQLEAMQRNNEFGVVHCNWLAVDESGKEMPAQFQITRQSWWHSIEGKAYPWVWMPHPAHFLYNPMHSMSLPLIRTQLVRDIGGFDPALVPSDDWDLWVRLSHITQFAFVSQVAAHYVFHEGQQHDNIPVAAKSQLVLTRKHPISLTRHPGLRLRQIGFNRWTREYMLYLTAKELLFGKKFHHLFSVLLKLIFVRPEALFHKRWIYLVSRAIRANTERF